MFIEPSNANAIRYTGRWDITKNTEATTTAPGSYIEFSFKGNYCLLKFDTETNTLPFPHLWIKVDCGAKIEVPLDRFIRIEPETSGTHIVKIIFKSSMEWQHRWYKPLCSKITFLGFEADDIDVLPADNREIIQFIGDSITEGVLINPELNPEKNDQKNRVYQDDSTATYAFLTAKALRMRPYIMGYGALGVVQEACGAVPPAPQSYPYNFHESKITPVNAKITIINLGVNDWLVEKDVFKANYKNLLNIVRRLNPKTKIVVLSPFHGTHSEDLFEIVQEYNNSKNENISFIDGSFWVPFEPLHPLRDGHVAIAEKLCKELSQFL